jgi:shikimate dehydrogenase
MDENTKICISIASHPGKFGLRFHNEGYKLLGLNHLYIPLGILQKDLGSLVNIIRNNFHGCSISMPHKIEAIKYLDQLDYSAKNTGSVNTILSLENGRILRGYNTDYYGTIKAISGRIGAIDKRKVLMIGAGGVARAIGRAIVDLNGDLYITNRTKEVGVALAEELKCQYFPWNNRSSFSGYLLINATSIGMNESGDSPINLNSLNNYGAVMDVIASGETSIIKRARELRMPFIQGKTMAVYQAEKQFEIYTGQKLPEKFVEGFLK